MKNKTKTNEEIIRNAVFIIGKIEKRLKKSRDELTKRLKDKK